MILVFGPPCIILAVTIACFTDEICNTDTDVTDGLRHLVIRIPSATTIQTPDRRLADRKLRGMDHSNTPTDEKVSFTFTHCQILKVNKDFTLK